MTDNVVHLTVDNVLAEAAAELASEKVNAHKDILKRKLKEIHAAERVVANLKEELEVTLRELR